ncbi:hypothetical protein DPMN_042850 [Dreissena polymorpha]|uniref:Uncharacterized protein n=1 Tax=Dreissena polymorpha TaxID=45954 RepID=A0A9D4HXC8_DREPO|nr:hypothetical protein DPMN_042801 [Dreissena polymorpha]KAH3736287.1 hypothetical protein DPMN_042850 [Dreissena polymorpha]
MNLCNILINSSGRFREDRQERIREPSPRREPGGRGQYRSPPRYREDRYHDERGRDRNFDERGRDRNFDERDRYRDNRYDERDRYREEVRRDDMRERNRYQDDRDRYADARRQRYRTHDCNTYKV